MTIVTPDLKTAAPAIFANGRADTTSEKFQFISTADIVAALQKEGFVPVRAKQTRVRIEARRDVARHVVTFRVPEAQPGALAPEIVLFNAHDGTCAYRLHAGIFRLVCENGLIVGKSVAALRVPHIGERVEEVLQGTHALAKRLPDVLDQIAEWQGTLLSRGQQVDFAHDALNLRFGPDYHPLTPEQVLAPRRHQDEASDLFTVMNVVQENLLRGGLQGVRADGKATRTRRLNGIQATTKLNLGLWDLTEQYHYSLN